MLPKSRKMNSPNHQLILASGSPRRKQLLEAAGYSFTVLVPDESVEQAVDSSLSPREFVIEAAFQKAKAVALAIANEVDSGIVLAADTVAECDGQIIGKPRDRVHAKEILLTMSGTSHAVLTGVCLWNCETGKSVKNCESTLLQMDELSADWLEGYLDSEKWRGKAGAFGYQDGLDWIRVVEGLESNVVGLPIEKLRGWLAEVGE